MNVLVADKFDSRGLDALRAAGAVLHYDPKLDGPALGQAVKATAAAVLIVRSTRVPADVLEASPTLGLVIRAGAGYDTIDVSAASRRGILVANCPGRNAVAVAELTFALILALDRRIVENVTDLRAGVWNKKQYAQARGLKGRTLGIVGMGRIGQEVAARARAFEMPVVAWSRSLSPEAAAMIGVRRCDSPAEVAELCDILSIHVAASRETTGLIDAAVLGRLRPGSYVINTARAEVMDYAALARLTSEKNLRVGLDVFPNEPAGGEGAFADAIVQAGGLVYGTHHIGASTDQAQDAIAEETVRLVRMYRATGKVDNCVNLSARPTTRFVLSVRHLNQPGVLAHVLACLSNARINVEEMENFLLSDKTAACATIRMDRQPPPAVLDAIRGGCAHVLAVCLAESPS